MNKVKFRTRLLILLILAIVLNCCDVACQISPLGYWTGTMNRDGSSMLVSFEFKTENNQLLGFFNSALQKASGIPLDKIRNEDDSLSFQLMSEPVTYFNCLVSKDKIEGQIFQEGFSTGLLSLSRSGKPSKTYSFSDTLFSSGYNKIACRIYLPNTGGKHPAIVFLHGSGGEGMYANQYLAEYLASKGMVTLIQDKQGVGKSTGNWTKANFDDLANDYITAVLFLKNFEQVNKAQIGIYGHSQGGTIAPLVASKSKDIAFIIAAASVGDSIYKQDLYRVNNNLRSEGVSPAETQQAMSYYRSWLNIARTGTGFEKLDTLNILSKDKKWFDWVEAPPKSHWIWKYYQATGNYNSLDYWKTISVPVLLVYGENDQIEDIKIYLHNIDKALMEQGKNKDMTQLLLPDAEHNLCIFPQKNDKFFWWYLSPGYEDLVAGWILYRFKNYSKIRIL